MMNLNSNNRKTRDNFLVNMPYFVGLLIFLLMALSTAYSRADATELDLITKAEKTIQNISTLQAEFTQISSDGSYAIGRLYFRRPFQMRLEYKIEEPYNVITTRKLLIIDEPAKKRAMNYPVSDTPFALLLKDKVSLIGDDFSTSSKISDGLIEITLSKDTGDSAGKLKLLFQPDDMNLRGWIIVDTLGVKTTVTLQNEIYGKKLKNNLFGRPIY